MNKSELTDFLRTCEEYLAKLQKEFKDQPLLLAIYEPSAKEIVRRVKVDLEESH